MTEKTDTTNLGSEIIQALNRAERIIGEQTDEIERLRAALKDISDCGENILSQTEMRARAYEALREAKP